MKDPQHSQQEFQFRESDSHVTTVLTTMEVCLAHCTHLHLLLLFRVCCFACWRTLDVTGHRQNTSTFYETFPVELHAPHNKDLTPHPFEDTDSHSHERVQVLEDNKQPTAPMWGSMASRTTQRHQTGIDQESQSHGRIHRIKTHGNTNGTMQNNCGKLAGN